MNLNCQYQANGQNIQLVCPDMAPPPPAVAPAPAISRVDEIWGLVAPHHYAIIATASVMFLLLFAILRGYRLFGVVVIGEDEVGIVTKKFAMRHLENGKIVAINGEAGLQAQVLSPGIHFGFWPWQYSINRDAITLIEEGHVGVVTAIDGEPIPPGRILGRHVECNSFQDVTAFMRGGGQRGPQASVLPPGEYRIQSEFFTIEDHPALDIPTGKVAIVTTMDGMALGTGEIAGPEIPGHESYQDADAFISGGGRRGLQEQVMMPGRRYVNPLFVSTELVDMTDVPIGCVGVIISYVGDVGVDQTGAEFTHGNIVKKGQRGVWENPLDPGRYPINPKIMSVEIVPTTNTVLNWITDYHEPHGLDEDLETIMVRSKDLFSFPLEVSQIIHIAAKNAPKVIARFGTVMGLVSQVLEPLIDNYFRNKIQETDFLDFWNNRSERQADAAAYIKAALGKLDVEAVDTLIGDIVPPEGIMLTMTERKVAEQQKQTFATQRASQEERQKFEQAKSEADTRGQIVQASREAEMATLQANAAVSKAEGEAKSLRIVGEATAAKALAIGDAEAKVLQLKVAAVGPGNYSAMDMIKQLAEGKTQLVPLVQMGQSETGGSPANALLGMLAANMAQQATHPIMSVNAGDAA
jgi:uncharacterized membrane protein YqiK